MLATRLACAAAPGQLRLAVIGGGPSAFYAAARVLSHFTADKGNESGVEVHMYERLPTPHGLVRYGVAPDHPEVKNVEHKFEQVAQDPRFHFFGNVNVGDDQAQGYPLANRVPLSELAPHYTHILFAYGSSLARPLGIPGSAPGELEHVHSALDFVNWYNGHPTAHDTSLRAGPLPFASLAERGGALEHMAVVGAGNVALDVARIVLRASCRGAGGASDTTAARDELAKTDVPELVLAALAQTRIRDVGIYARRGPADVAFTNKELREMMALPGVAFRPLEAAQLDEAQQRVDTIEGGPEAKSAARVKNRLLSLLAKGSQTAHDPSSAQKTWSLNFYRAPAALEGDKAGGGRALRNVTWNLTRPPARTAAPETASVHDTRAWGNPGPAVAPPTGEQETTRADLLISSIGYRSEPLASTLPFDTSRAVVPNADGRVKDASGQPLPGRYVSGWLARGPVGVIASTMYDAYSVADLIHQDWQKGVAQTSEPADGLPAPLRQPAHKVVNYKDWLRIDEVERERGAKLGKLREKILTVREMLDVTS